LICWIGISLYMASPAACQDTAAIAPPVQINKAKLFVTIAGETAVCAGISYYLQTVWYKDHNRVPFHFHNDNRAYLQMDKFGHVFSAYAESYIGYKLLRNAGVKKGPALLYGGSLGIILQAPIEIFDGLYDDWGFSWGDMVGNTVGACLVVGQELLFDDLPLKYKLSYKQSPYYLSASGLRVENPLRRSLFDYNGHTYWLSLPLNKIVPSAKIPPWLALSAGYGATGMSGKFENTASYNGIVIPPTERYRKYLLSLDIDWTKIKTSSKFLKAVLNCMVFIKLPFPAIEFNSLGKVRGHWIYY
jgi:hypothetical protein